MYHWTELLFFARSKNLIEKKILKTKKKKKLNLNCSLKHLLQVPEKSNSIDFGVSLGQIFRNWQMRHALCK